MPQKPITSNSGKAMMTKESVADLSPSPKAGMNAQMTHLRVMTTEPIPAKKKANIMRKLSDGKLHKEGSFGYQSTDAIYAKPDASNSARLRGAKAKAKQYSDWKTPSKPPVK